MQDRTSVDGVRRVMMVSLSDGSPPETHEQWVKMWATLLSQKALTDTTFCGMLESLIAGYYFERSGDFTPILPYLNAIEANKKNLSKFTGKCIFRILSANAFIIFDYCKIHTLHLQFYTDILLVYLLLEQ